MANVKKLDGNKVSIEIHVTADKFEEGMQKAYIKNKSKYSIPGFRKGKAPRKMLETYYGEGLFFEDAFDEIFPDVYGEAIKENNLEIVSRPENFDIKEISRENGIDFTVEAYVKPEVVVKKYKGIEVTRVDSKVSAKEVDAEVKRIQEENIRWVEVDREAKSGDTVVLDYKGSVDGKEFEGGSAEASSLLLGSNTFIPGFEDQLVGAKAGEDRDVSVKFPEEYHAKDLAGKDAVFACRIISVKEKEVPEINDEFASDVSEYETLAEFKKSIKKDLSEKAERRAKDIMENELIEKIVKATPIDVPQSMIDDRIDYQIQQMSYSLLYQGLKLEDYLKYLGKTMDDLRAEYKDMAELQVKSQLCIEALIKQENIEAPEKDIDVLLADAADQLSKTVEEYKKDMTDEDREYFENRVKVDRLFDFLMENAKITEPKKETEKKPAAKKSPAKKADSKKETEKKAPAKKAAAKKTETK